MASSPLDLNKNPYISLSDYNATMAFDSSDSGQAPYVTISGVRFTKPGIYTMSVTQKLSFASDSGTSEYSLAPYKTTFFVYEKASDFALTFDRKSLPSSTTLSLYPETDYYFAGKDSRLFSSSYLSLTYSYQKTGEAAVTGNIDPDSPLSLEEGDYSLGVTISDSAESTSFSLASTSLQVASPKPEFKTYDVPFQEGNSLTLKEGESATLHISSSFADNEYVYSLSDSSIASISAGSSSGACLVTGLKAGVTTLTAVATTEYASFTAKISLTVTPKEAYRPNQEAISFVEGDVLTLLSGKSGALHLDESKVDSSYTKITWISLNPAVISLDTGSSDRSLEAKLTAVDIGDTEVIAVVLDGQGDSYLSIITVHVIEAVPEIGIKVEKADGDDGTALSQYDSLKVEFDPKGFEFSGEATIRWTLDGEILNDNQNKVSFALSPLVSGIHELGVSLNDEEYGFANLKASKSISVSSLAQASHELTFVHDQVTLGLGLNRYSINCLLDGVIDDDRDYSFAVSDPTILSLSQSVTSSSSIQIDPLKEGSAEISVYTEVDTKPKSTLYATMKVTVKNPNSLHLVADTSFPKPGKGITITVKDGNSDEPIRNLDLSSASLSIYTPEIVIPAMSDPTGLLGAKKPEDVPASCSYSVDSDNATIKILQPKQGNLYVDLKVAGQDTLSLKLDVTAYSVQEFAATVLPWLILALIVSILVISLVKFAGDPSRSVSKAVSKLEFQLKKSKKALGKKSLEDKDVAKEYGALNQKVRNVWDRLTYYEDEGIDEFRYAQDVFFELKNIFNALLRSKSLTPKNAASLLDSLDQYKIQPALEEVKEAMGSKQIYDEQLKQEKKKDKVSFHFHRPSYMNESQYKEYLAEHDIFVDQGENSGSNGSSSGSK